MCLINLSDSLNRLNELIRINESFIKIQNDSESQFLCIILCSEILDLAMSMRACIFSSRV